MTFNISAKTNRTKSIIARGLVCVLILSAWTQIFGADNLSEKQRAQLDSITETYRIGDMTIKEAAAEGSGRGMGPRLLAFTRWLVGLEKPTGEILEDIDKRYKGFVSSDTHTIATSNLQWAGSPEPPVRIVAYVSSSCNLCKHIVGAIHDSITAGATKNKISLLAKPFGAGIGDVALYAAASQGRFWDLFSQMRENKSRYDDQTVIDMAQNIGIPAKRFATLLNMPEYRRMLKRGREESAVNDVKYAPVFFINGKRYRSYKDPQWVIDAALMEYERNKANDSAIKK